MKRLFPILLLALSLFLASCAQAQSPTPLSGEVTADQVNAVARQLYCPVCENIPLDQCPTQACVEWRELIHDKLAAGWSEDQIKDYFVEQFGDRVIGVPPARGLNWLVYVVPPLAFLAGVFILYRAMRSWSRPAPAPVVSLAEPAQNENEYVKRLEEELRKR